MKISPSLMCLLLMFSSSALADEKHPDFLSPGSSHATETCPHDREDSLGHVWLSLVPAGPPVGNLEVDVGDTFTLHVVFEFEGIGTEFFAIPIGFDSLVEVVDMDFNYESFNFLGFCLEFWNFFPSVHPGEHTVTWYAYTPYYTTCCTPDFCVLDIGFVSFACLGSGSTTLRDTLTETGLPLIAGMCGMA